MKKVVTLTLIVLMTSLLTACGFQLRGAGSNLDLAAVWLSSAHPNADFERLLKRRLITQDAELVEFAQNADIQLAIVDYATERRTVGRDSFGRAVELELIVTLNYQMARSDATEVATQQSMRARREFAYNRTLSTGQAAEEKALIHDMYQELISRLLVEMAQNIQ